MKGNPGKFQFMILVKKNRSKQILKVSLTEIKEKEDVLLLGITIDNEVSFKKHIGNLCRTAQYKLQALISRRQYLIVEKARILGSSLIDCHFHYAPRTSYLDVL